MLFSCLVSKRKTLVFHGYHFHKGLRALSEGSFGPAAEITERSQQVVEALRFSPEPAMCYTEAIEHGSGQGLLLLASSIL